ncbi:ribonuclease III [Jonesia denitrificans DSM 20603]|uniref:Ribonuclease 3 n=1 Tax=Jonesia denitrificans (strain ATCC 14870 / DSM 20603 / BCRC 15368 / CIP 55.134 / JCM 11481 / NBRC 15587 / NCTC 10816 / Prevot 55134) TaxID=471856 RepID=C7QYS4_JONDD|nr:ribonuclease III [Jonesia denitrificans DSM 20603]SQH21576.1 Ribonuclease 3 [Jonesia denitrificans]
MASAKDKQAAPASELLSKLGIHLDPELLVLALTHRSFAHEAGGIPTNERLEFLGDAVLGLVSAEALFRGHPDRPEGDLARMRAATVSQRPLAQAARTLNLGSYILLGKGESRTGGADKDSILSDTVEAIIGAVYVTHGLETAREFVHRLLGETMREAATMGAGLDWKTAIQELCAQLGYPQPTYDFTSQGPDHARVFTSTVVIEDRRYGSGEGTSKKLAEQQAAHRSYDVLVAERDAAQGK